MRNKKLIYKIADMIYTGGCVIRDGCYNLSKSHFIDACEELRRTGDDKLGEHDKLTWLSWENNPKTILPDEDCLLFQKVLADKTFWHLYAIFSASEVDLIKTMVNYTEQYRKRQETAAFKRREACRYTAKCDIRDAVFKRDGKVCKSCKAIENLSLDHVIPVTKGGENSLENMQVLCKSCNSKKSDHLEGDKNGI